MFEESQQNLFESIAGELMPSSGDSHVKTLVSPGQAPVLMASDQDCGLRYIDWFAKLDLSSSSWKTCQLCLDGGWEEFSATWPRVGMMRNGECFQLANLELHTHANVCSSLPTPTASDVADILTSNMKYRADTRTGKPRRIAPSGGTFSAGLNRLFKMATGFWLMPSFCEWMMGFPKGWTEITHSETLSSHKSPK